MDALPKGMERRMVLRLLTHWRELCDGRDFPTFDDIDPAAIPDMWPCCFVIEYAGEGNEPVFRVMGDDFINRCMSTYVNRPISDVPTDTLLSQATSYTSEVLRKQVPISRGGEFITSGGVTVLYRSILLPMSDDGATMTGILGAANCREVYGDDEEQPSS